MPQVPAQCERCGAIVNSRIFIGGNSTVWLSNNRTNCRFCGGDAYAAEGFFEVVDDVIQLVNNTTITQSFRSQLLQLAIQAAEQRIGEGEFHQRASAIHPAIADFLESHRGFSFPAMVLMIVIAISSFVGAKATSGNYKAFQQCLSLSPQQTLDAAKNRRHESLEKNGSSASRGRVADIRSEYQDGPDANALSVAAVCANASCRHVWIAGIKEFEGIEPGDVTQPESLTCPECNAKVSLAATGYSPLVYTRFPEEYWDRVVTELRSVVAVAQASPVEVDIYVNVKARPLLAFIPDEMIPNNLGELKTFLDLCKMVWQAVAWLRKRKDKPLYVPEQAADLADKAKTRIRIDKSEEILQSRNARKAARKKKKKEAKRRRSHKRLDS